MLAAPRTILAQLALGGRKRLLPTSVRCGPEQRVAIIRRWPCAERLSTGAPIWTWPRTSLAYW